MRSLNYNYLIPKNDELFEDNVDPFVEVTRIKEKGKHKISLSNKKYV